MPKWRAEDGHHLSRSFEFPDFASALGFVNRVAEIDGLTENDFILAAKRDAAL